MSRGLGTLQTCACGLDYKVSVFTGWHRVLCLLCLPLSFSLHSTKVNSLMTENQQILRQSTKRQQNRYSKLSAHISNQHYCKILEHIIYSFISTHLSDYNILSPHHKFLKPMMLYILLHGLVDVSVTFTPLLTPTRGYSQHFITPFTRNDTYLNSFLLSTINLWNSLPDSLVALDDIDKPPPCRLILCICAFILL